MRDRCKSGLVETKLTSRIFVVRSSHFVTTKVLILNEMSLWRTSMFAIWKTEKCRINKAY